MHLIEMSPGVQQLWTIWVAAVRATAYTREYKRGSDSVENRTKCVPEKVAHLFRSTTDIWWAEALRAAPIFEVFQELPAPSLMGLSHVFPRPPDGDLRMFELHAEYWFPGEVCAHVTNGVSYMFGAPESLGELYLDEDLFLAFRMLLALHVRLQCLHAFDESSILKKFSAALPALNMLLRFQAPLPGCHLGHLIAAYVWQQSWSAHARDEFERVISEAHAYSILPSAVTEVRCGGCYG